MNVGLIRAGRISLMGCLIALASSASAATHFENVESASPPALPAGWTAVGTPAWIVTNGVPLDATLNAGSKTFRATTTGAATNTGWLVRGPYTVSGAFTVDAMAKAAQMVAGFSPAIDIALGFGASLPSAAAFTNHLASWSVVGTSAWQHESLSRFAGDVPEAWHGRTDVYVGFRVRCATNAIVLLDNVLLGDAFQPNAIEPFEAGTLSEDWVSKWLTSSSATWTENATRNAPGSAGGSVMFNSAYTLNVQARLQHHNQIASGGREVVVLSFKTYNESSARQDWIQPVLTLDDWSTSIALGAALPRYLADYAVNSWVTRCITNVVTGMGDKRFVRVGLRGMSSPTGGVSGRDIYVDDLSVNLITDLFLDDLKLCHDSAGTNAISGLTYTNAVYVSVSVNARPASAITVDNCSLDYWTADGTISNTVVMTKHPASGRHVAPVSQSPLEAGQTLRYRVRCDYTFNESSQSATKFLPAQGAAERTVAGLGSVWINEVARAGGSASNQFVELCAPKQRSVSGWALQIIDWAAAVTNVLDGITHAFTDQSNGFGFWVAGGTGVAVRDRLLTVALPEHCGLRLVNGAGIVEDSLALGSATNIPGYRATVQGSAMGALLTGYAQYQPGSLHSSFATNFQAQATVAPSPGEPNALQGFLVSGVETTLSGSLLDALDDAPVSFGTLQATAFFHGGSVTTQLVANASGNIAAFTLSGRHSADTVDISWVAAGFGYETLTEASVAATGAGGNPLHEMKLSGGPGVESFDGADLRPFWKQWLAVPESVTWSHGEKKTGAYKGAWVVANSAYVIGINKFSVLYAENALRTYGGGSVDIQFDVRNETLASVDNVALLLSSNGQFGASGLLKQFPLVPHNESVYADKQWVTHRYRWRSSAIVGLDRLYAGMKCIPAANSASGRDFVIDNLRVAVGQGVGVESFGTRPAVPRAGSGISFSAMLRPWGSGVSNVTPRVHYRVGNGGWAVANMTPQPFGLTSVRTITATNVLTSLAPQDVVDYYISITFDGADAASSIVYAPDNTVYDMATGVDVITNNTYAPVATRFTVQDIGDVWFNEIKALPAGTTAQHFIELAGITNINLGGWKVEVKDLVGDGTTTYTIPGGTLLTNSPTGDYAFYMIGGASVSPAPQQALTAALPLHGGLRLIDASDVVRYAVSYDASGDNISSNSVGYEYLGNADGAVSFGAVGRGNPANIEFGWTGLTAATPSGVNPGQEMVNEGPSPNPAQLAPVAPADITVSSLSVAAVTATDYDKPVEYRIEHNGVWGGWSTNRATLFSGLGENTRHIFRSQARDSLGKTNAFSSPVTNYTLLNTPATPTVVGTATDAVQVSGTVPNLGTGQTKMRFQLDGGGLSDWEADGIVEVSGLDPNTVYLFTAQARNGGGVETAFSGTGSGYTLALAPVTAPVPDKDGNQVRLYMTNGWVAGQAVNTDGNPTNTQYAVATFTQGAGTTNYLSVNGAVQSTPGWLTLPAWNGIWAQLPDITVTNFFFLVARNGDGVQTAPGPASAIGFEMAISARSAEQLTDNSGRVRACAALMNPWTNVCRVGLSYSLDNVTWFSASVVSNTVAYGTPLQEDIEAEGVTYQLQNVPTHADGTNTVCLFWDARTAIGEVTTNVSLLWHAVDPLGGAPAAPDSIGPIALDFSRPGVQSVTTTSPEPFKDAPMPVTVVFTETVTGFAVGDVTVGNGTAGNFAGSGTTYTFDVTPSGQGAVTVMIAQNVCQDAAGNLNTASVSPALTRTYDSIAPAISNLAVTPAITNLNGLVVIAFDVTDVHALAGNPTVTVNGHAASYFSKSGTRWTYRYTVQASDGDGAATVAVGATDVAGNTGTLSDATKLTVDKTAPVVSNLAVTPGITNLNGLVVIAFDVTEANALRANPTVTVNGHAAEYISKSGNRWTYRYTVTGADGDGAATVAVGATDIAGNTGTLSDATKLVIDNTAPKVTINQAVGQADPTGVQPIFFTVVFDESVTGFDADDVLIEGTAPGDKHVVVTGGGANYTVAVSNLTDSGTVIVSIPAGGARDTLGNGNEASTSTDNSVTYDATAPVVELVGLPSSPTMNGHLAVTATVTDGDEWRVGLANNGTPALSFWRPLVGDELLIYTNGLAEGTWTLVVQVKDEAGNVGGTNFVWTIDRTGPTVAIAQVGLGTVTNNTVSFSICVSEPCAAFNQGLVQLAGSNVTGVVNAFDTAGALCTTVTVSQISGSGTLTLSVPAGVLADAAGNVNTAGSATVQVGCPRPIPVITFDSRTLAPSPLYWLVTFDTPVAAPVLGDFMVRHASSAAGGGVATIETVVPNQSYKVSVTNWNDQGRVGLHLPANAVQSLGSEQGNHSSSTNFAPVNLLLASHGCGSPQTGEGTWTDPQLVADGLLTNFGSVTVTPAQTGSITYQMNQTGAAVSFSRLAILPHTANPVTNLRVQASMAANGPWTTILPVWTLPIDPMTEYQAALTNCYAKYLKFTLPVQNGTSAIRELGAFGDPADTSLAAPIIVLSDPRTNGLSEVHFDLHFAEKTYEPSPRKLSLVKMGTADAPAEGITAISYATGTWYRVTVPNVTGNGELGLLVASGFAKDAFNNLSAAATSARYVIDHQHPEVTGFTRYMPAGETNTASLLTWRLAFSEPVTAPTADDFSVTSSNVTAVIHQVAGIPGGTNYYVSVYVSDIDGTGSVHVALGAAAVADLAGNLNAAGAISQTYVLSEPQQPDPPPPPASFTIQQTVGPHGSASPAGNFDIVAGTSTTVVYTADEWYRIASLTVNGEAVPAAAGEPSYSWQIVGADRNNSSIVTFAALDTYSSAIMSWFNDNDWSEADIETGDGDDLDIETEHLLNTDPTVSTTYTFGVMAVSVASGGSVVNVTVRLTRDEASKLGDINGTLYLYGTANLLGGGFTEIANTAISGADFSVGNEDTHTYSIPAGGARSFYKAVIK